MPSAKKATRPRSDGPAGAGDSADDKVAARTERADSADREDTDQQETPTSVSQPVDPNPPVTVEDSTGTERIVVPRGDGWEPAPVDVSDEELAAAEAAGAAGEEAKRRRLTPLEERAEQSRAADDNDDDDDVDRDTDRDTDADPRL